MALVAHKLLPHLNMLYQKGERCIHPQSVVEAIKFDLGNLDALIASDKRRGNRESGFYEVKLPAERSYFEIEISRNVRVHVVALWADDMVAMRACSSENGRLALTSRYDYILESRYDHYLWDSQTGKGISVQSVLDSHNTGDVESMHIHCMLSVISVLTAMECQNVIRVAQKTPKLINRKRMKKKKQPLFEHYTLEIDISAEKELPEAEPGVGTGPARRLHFCRGHVRHTKSGKQVWVRGHYRGDVEQGAVSKDYEVKTP